MSRAIAIIAGLWLAGCALSSTAPMPFEYYGASQAPPLIRVALLPSGWNTWSGWSEEMAVASAAVDAEVIATLRESPRIYDASFLPSILVPDKRTVPFLREAAARYQADLMMVFRPGCQAFERYRWVGADRSRAHCAVEAARQWQPPKRMQR